MLQVGHLPCSSYLQQSGSVRNISPHHGIRSVDLLRSLSVSLRVTGERADVRASRHPVVFHVRQAPSASHRVFGRIAGRCYTDRRHPIRHGSVVFAVDDSLAAHVVGGVGSIGACGDIGALLLGIPVNPNG